MKQWCLVGLAALVAVLPVRGGVEFDGVDDYVTVSSASLDNIWDSGGTFSFWCYPRTAGEANAGFFASKNQWALQSLSSHGGGETGLEFRVSWSGGVAVWRGNTSPQVTTGAWHHVAVTYDTDSAVNDPVIYVDGVSVTGITEVVAPSGARATDAGSSFQLGGNTAGTRASDGYFSETQFYDRSLTASEISIIASSRLKGPKFSGLVAYWPLDDVPDGESADGDTFVDRAGSANATGNDGANNTGLTGRAEDYLSYP